MNDEEFRTFVDRHRIHNVRPEDMTDEDAEFETFLDFVSTPDGKRSLDDFIKNVDSWIEEEP